MNNNNREELKKLAQEYMDEARKAEAKDKLEEAIALCQKSINIMDDIEDPADNEQSRKLVIAYNNQAVLYAVCGKQELAIDFYMKALYQAKESGYALMEALIYNNIAIEYNELSNHKQSNEYLEYALRAIDAPESKKDHRYPTYALLVNVNLARNYAIQFRLTEAEKHVEKARTFLDKAEKGNGFDAAIENVTCRIKWEQGDIEWVENHIDGVIESLERGEDSENFFQNASDIIYLVSRMPDYGRWERVLNAVEKVAEQRDSVFCYMRNADYWCNYYKAVGDMAQYNMVCSDFMDYYKKHNENEMNDRSSQITSQIALFHKNKTMQNQKEEQRDTVTNARNRQRLEREYNSLLAEVKGGILCMGYVDIDKFRKINDEYGLMYGDEVLKELAQILKDSTGEYGSVYRLSADKFILLLADTNEDVLNALAEDIHKKAKVSVSIGFSYMKADRSVSCDQFIEIAEKVKEVCKKNNPGGTLVVENSHKDYHQFYLKYNAILEEEALLEKMFREANDKEEWIMFLDQRKLKNNELREENEKLINHYLEPLLNGAYTLDDEAALTITHEIWDMFNQGKMDYLVMLEIGRVVEAYLEENQHMEEHICMLVVLGEAYISLGGQDNFDSAMHYYSKLSIYREYIDQIEKRSVKQTVCHAFLRGRILGAETGNTNLFDTLQQLDEEMEYYQNYKIKEQLRLSDDQSRDALDNLIVNFITAATTNLDTVDPDSIEYQTAMVWLEDVYRRKLKNGDSEYDISSKLFGAYHHVRYLVGKDDLETCYENHKSYFEKNINREEPEYKSTLELVSGRKFKLMMYYVPKLFRLSKELKTRETKEEEFLNNLIELYMIYISSLSKGGSDTELTNVLWTSLSEMMKYIPEWVDAFDLFYRALIERDVDGSIHSRMVSEISTLMTDMVMRNKPSLFINNCGCETEDQVLASKDRIEKFVEHAGLVFDIGKMKMLPITRKQTRKLSDIEFENVKRHPEIGLELITNCRSLKYYIPVVLGHHRYYNDRLGYPEEYRYKKEANPFIVNIVQLADSLNAATDKIARNYQRGKSLDEVFAEFEREKSVRYNPDLVNMMLKDEEFKKELQQIITEGREEICYEIYNSVNTFRNKE